MLHDSIANILLGWEIVYNKVYGRITQKTKKEQDKVFSVPSATEKEVIMTFLLDSNKDACCIF